MKPALLHFFALCLLALSCTVQASSLSIFKGDPRSPVLKLVDLTGKPHDLSDYAGRVVLINFWASWCPPCVEELPSLQRLQSRYDGKNFSVLPVDVGEDKDTIEQFLQLIDPVELTVLLDPEARAHHDWKIYVFPTSFLIDQNGIIRYGAVGALEWDNASVTEIIDDLLLESE